MRRLGVAVMACVVLAGAVGAVAAQARIDRDYGEEGIVVVKPPLPSGWQTQYVRGLAAARDGSAYALLQRVRCGSGYEPCTASFAVVRYTVAGNLDTSFGGPSGYRELPFATGETPTLIVDSAGRPVIAQTAGRELSVVRLGADGNLDPSFGGDGAVGFNCDCGYGELQLIAGPRGSLTVAVPRSGGGREGAVVGLVRLKGDGSFDKRFGADGSTNVGLPKARQFTAAATGKGGALYLAGPGCCKSGTPPYLDRISVKGHFDRRFAKESRASLRALKRIGSVGQNVTAILLRSRGRVDVLGGAGYDRGFVLRLNKHGKAMGSFAKRGLRSLPLPIDSAARGSDGAAMVLSSNNLRAVGIVMRVRADGSVDRRFGRELVPGSQGSFGLSIAGLAQRRALVLDLALQECRGYCPSQPQLVRYAEGH